VKIGSLDLGALKPGEFRYLSQDEVERLRKTSKRRAAANPPAAGNSRRPKTAKAAPQQHA
jgi:hypothetical protein